MAEQFPYFKFYVQDFLASSKVDLMCTRAIGAYILLICKAWHQSPPATIPDDDSTLARWARLSLEDWMGVRSCVLGAWVAESGRWKQPRLRDEYDRLMAETRKNTERGKRGAEARWRPKPMPEQCSSIAQALLKDAIQNQNQNQNQTKPKPPPTPLPVVEPVADAGRSECVHPAERFRATRDAKSVTPKAILAVYPKPGGANAALNAIADALVRIRRGSDPSWPDGVPPPADPAAWLLGRVRAYAASPVVRHTPRNFLPAAVDWFGEGKYLEPPEAWEYHGDQRAAKVDFEFESAESIAARLGGT